MSKDKDTAFFGHPIGLSTLFFTEMWERFSYYGMRAFLIFYMVGAAEKGGRGMSDASAGIVMGLYTSGVYILSLPGGWIADRFLGQRRGVTIGGIGIMLGNLMLALPVDALFFPGLATIAIGTGLLKPNISTIDGQLYSADDIRRDAGYTVYSMGINIGALFAPIACGFFAQSDTFREFLGGIGIDPNLCWHVAFGASAVGMAAGLIQYLMGFARLGEAGLHPTVPSEPAKAKRDVTVLRAIIAGVVGVIALAIGLSVADVKVSEDLIGNVFGVALLIAAVGLFYGMLKTARDQDERRRVIAMIPLFIGGIAFFGTFEQASTTINLFTDRTVERIVPPSYFQAINSIFIILIAPVFAALWIWLARNKKEPSSVNKFGLGMIFTALAFAVLLPTLGAVVNISGIDHTIGLIPFASDAVDKAVDPMRVSSLYLVGLYFFQTTSELCISPVGLSSMSKLAPARMAGMVMGTWFLATGIGNYLAGRAAGFSASRGFGFLFYTLILISLGISAALFAVAPMIRRMASGASPSAPLPKAVANE